MFNNLAWIHQESGILPHEMLEAHSWYPTVWPYLYNWDSWAYQATIIHGSNYQKAQQPVWSRSQAWEGHPSTSCSSAPHPRLSWTTSWSLLDTTSKSPKKQVAGSYSVWQQPPTCWSMEMCYPLGYSGVTHGPSRLHDDDNDDIIMDS